MKKEFQSEELILQLKKKREESFDKRLHNQTDTEAYTRAYVLANRIARNDGEFAFRKELLRQFSEQMPVVKEEFSPFQGSRRFDPIAPVKVEETKRYVWTTHGHSIINWEELLKKGPAEIENEILTMEESPCKDSFLTAIRSFRFYIRRHNGCEALADRPPETLLEALQLIWFGQIFLRAEGASAAISLGRMDEYLLPYAEQCSDEEILYLLKAWSAKCCEGDESQNVTLGEASSDRLTILFLKALRESQIWQPSLSLRVSSKTSQSVWDEALALTCSGSGQPSYFNSEVVMKALRTLDFPEERIPHWGIVGCYEATIPYETAPFTTAATLDLPGVLMDFLKQITIEPVDFVQFTEEFLSYFRAIDWKNTYTEIKDFLGEYSITHFESLMIDSCRRKGKVIAHGGGQYNTLGVLMLGIGTLLDSMLAIRKRVYEDRSMSLKELTVRTLNNAPGSKNDYPCFGKPEPEIEGLAHYVSGEICRHLLGITLPDGTKLSPSYFLFGADIMKDYPATPDGRLNGERVSYGCMPSEWHDLSLTERLRAAAQITHDLTPNGSPAMLSFSKDLLTPDKVKALIQGYFELGGSHLHLNLQDKESLKEARIHPEEHRELLVRVSGYSAPFVSMPDRWQQALIERMD